jgi:hypothetical protein
LEFDQQFGPMQLSTFATISARTGPAATSELSLFLGAKRKYFEPASGSFWRKADLRPILHVAEGQQQIIQNTTTSSP